METARCNVPVALIFFNRPEQFARVFETVKIARPTRLFLIQDGPRVEHPKDVINIQKCREILKEIDWDCQITADFSDENLGCGKRIYTGLTRCFQQVDRLIILEDDCVPSQSFFPFCEEILELYKEDNRIGWITGMNHLNRFDKVKSDYFFSSVGSIAGWATWRRAWEQVSFDLSEVACDSEAMRLLLNYQKYAPHKSRLYSMAKEKYEQMQNGEKLSSWSTQFGIQQYLNSRLTIVPKKNLMINIGLTEESANSVSSIKFIPRKLRPLYQLDLFEMDFPIKHPKYVMSDIEYGKAVDKMMNPNQLISICRKIESVCLRLFGGDFKSLYKGIKRRLNKMRNRMKK